MLFVSVYGFGSAFHNVNSAQDVDLLIIHQGTSQVSCAMAIKCKQKLLDGIARAHLTMLSDTEEEQFQFIKTAGAVCLGTIRADHIDGDMVAIKSALPKLSERNL